MNTRFWTPTPTPLEKQPGEEAEFLPVSVPSPHVERHAPQCPPSHDGVVVDLSISRQDVVSLSFRPGISASISFSRTLVPFLKSAGFTPTPPPTPSVM
ncbi:hypothetical protein DPEC_G00360280 [Dallia pectoralis]|uniref:Uncharacterized protein n=1 Tax=Dallia pectoralis TaxID=75939 RepID=A0ACC2F0V5_DALPE|nr:hypothetical protein DPEC_G00360280 [Dallia pectoralis]